MFGGMLEGPGGLFVTHGAADPGEVAVLDVRHGLTGECCLEILDGN
jgi:hypothetical protein